VKERDKRRRDTFGVLSAAACDEFKEAPRRARRRISTADSAAARNLLRGAKLKQAKMPALVPSFSPFPFLMCHAFLLAYFTQH